jgi:hypothetical protein
MIELLVNLPSPISELQHAPLPLKCYEPGSTSQLLLLSLSSLLDSQLSPSRSLGCVKGITLLKLFSGIGTSLEALLQLGMVVRKYFYVDIDPITRQVATSKMMQLTTRFPQQFAIIAWKASFIFLPSNIQLIQKKHMELLGPVDLIISRWEC